MVVQIVQWFCSMWSFSHKVFFLFMEGHYPSLPTQAGSWAFPYCSDEKSTELKSKKRYFNKWHRSSIYVPILCSCVTAHSKSGFNSNSLHFGSHIWEWVGPAGCSSLGSLIPWCSDGGRGWLIWKTSSSTYLVPGLGRVKQLRLEWLGLLRYLLLSLYVVVSTCFLYMETSAWWEFLRDIWRLSEQASKEKQEGVAWLFLA